jgi:hypothetical protein
LNRNNDAKSLIDIKNIKDVTNDEVKSSNSIRTVDKIKKNNMTLISDFSGEDCEFIFKILSGKYLSGFLKINAISIKNYLGLTIVDEWEIKENSEDEDNFSYIEDI